MDVVMTLLVFTGLCLVAGFFGADSRPLDLQRPTRWLWPPERR
jgi:hypothetical protein